MPGWKWIVAILLGCLVRLDAQAADCGREDVEYYLNRGFTPEQITRLCTVDNTAGEDTASQNPADYESLPPTPAPPETETPAAYLSGAIDSDAVFVDDDTVYFQRTVCSQLGTANRRVCPDITFEIDLAGLQITGDNENGIEVRGDIQRKINNYDELSSREQQVVERYFDKSGTVIPIQAGADIEQARDALQFLVENANPPLVVSE